MHTGGEKREIGGGGSRKTFRRESAVFIGVFAVYLRLERLERTPDRSTSGPRGSRPKSWPSQPRNWLDRRTGERSLRGEIGQAVAGEGFQFLDRRVEGRDNGERGKMLKDVRGFGSDYDDRNVARDGYALLDGLTL